MIIEKNKIVSIRYIMKNRVGDVLENTMTGNPIQFLYGSSDIHQDLQTPLAGLKIGDKQTVFLKLSENEDFIFDVLIDDIQLKIAPERAPLFQLIVQNCDGNCDCHND